MVVVMDACFCEKDEGKKETQIGGFFDCSAAARYLFHST